MPRDAARSAAVAHVLYAAVIGRGAPHRVDEIARRIGVATRTVQAWAENERTLPAWAIPAIYRATHDPQLFSDLTEASDLGLVVTEGQRASGGQGADPMHVAVRVGAAAGAVQQAVVAAEADRVWTLAEVKALESEANELERSIARLRAAARSREV